MVRHDDMMILSRPNLAYLVLLQPEYGEPTNARDYLPSLTADRDKHIGDDLILQVSLRFLRVYLG